MFRLERRSGPVSKTQSPIAAPHLAAAGRRDEPATGGRRDAIVLAHYDILGTMAGAADYRPRAVVTQAPRPANEAIRTAPARGRVRKIAGDPGPRWAP